MRRTAGAAYWGHSGLSGVGHRARPRCADRRQTLGSPPDNYQIDRGRETSYVGLVKTAQYDRTIGGRDLARAIEGLPPLAGDRAPRGRSHAARCAHPTARGPRGPSPISSGRPRERAHPRAQPRDRRPDATSAPARIPCPHGGDRRAPPRRCGSAIASSSSAAPGTSRSCARSEAMRAPI